MHTPRIIRKVFIACMAMVLILIFILTGSAAVVALTTNPMSQVGHWGEQEYIDGSTLWRFKQTDRNIILAGIRNVKTGHEYFLHPSTILWKLKRPIA